MHHDNKDIRLIYEITENWIPNEDQRRRLRLTEDVDLGARVDCRKTSAEQIHVTGVHAGVR